MPKAVAGLAVRLRAAALSVWCQLGEHKMCEWCECAHHRSEQSHV